MVGSGVLGDSSVGLGVLWKQERGALVLYAIERKRSWISDLAQIALQGALSGQSMFHIYSDK